jgi:hypothetical protein
LTVLAYHLLKLLYQPELSTLPETPSPAFVRAEDRALRGGGFEL